MHMISWPPAGHERNSNGLRIHWLRKANYSRIQRYTSGCGLFCINRKLSGFHYIVWRWKMILLWKLLLVVIVDTGVHIIISSWMTYYFAQTNCTRRFTWRGFTPNYQHISLIQTAENSEYHAELIAPSFILTLWIMIQAVSMTRQFELSGSISVDSVKVPNVRITGLQIQMLSRLHQRERSVNFISAHTCLTNSDWIWLKAASKIYAYF